MRSGNASASQSRQNSKRLAQSAGGMCDFKWKGFCEEVVLTPCFFGCFFVRLSFSQSLRNILFLEGNVFGSSFLFKKGLRSFFLRSCFVKSGDVSFASFAGTCLAVNGKVCVDHHNLAFLGSVASVGPVLDPLYTCLVLKTST